MVGASTEGVGDVPPDQIRLLAKVARMYHERGMRQPSIAAQLHISQSRVSRLLKRAVEAGIVRTTVITPRGVHTDLEDQLEERYGLLEVVVILPYLAFGIPYQVFFLYGFFRSIPRDLDEAARIDGAGNLRLFWQVLLPLAKPALAALFILDFVATWNEYGMALVLLQDQNTQTMPLALQNFQSQFNAAYGPLNAFIVMSILPVLIVYLMFQRYFTNGSLAGAVKG